MGLGMRIFIVKDDGSLEGLPFGRYNRLLGHESNERLRQYAGKRVRCAVIVVESKGRIPVEILKSQYSYLSFDYDRRLLEQGDERQVRLAMATLEPVIVGSEPLPRPNRNFLAEALDTPYPNTQVLIH